MSNRTVSEVIAYNDKLDAIRDMLAADQIEEASAALDAIEDESAMDDTTVAPGQTFRQQGGRLLHIYVGDVTRTDRGGNVLHFSGAACGASYQPGTGDRREVSDRKVCAKCARATNA